MTPLQCRLGRTAIGWSAQQLATAASVAVNTVTKFERGSDARVSTVNAMRAVLEKSGVEFLSAGQASPGGGEGVRVADAAQRSIGPASSASRQGRAPVQGEAEVGLSHALDHFASSIDFEEIDVSVRVPSEVK